MGQEEVETEAISLSSSSKHCIGRDQSNWFSWTYNNDDYDSMDSNSSSLILQSNLRDAAAGGSNEAQGMDSGNGQMQILRQAQMLLTKNILYQKIDMARRQLASFWPAVFDTLPRTSADDSVVTAMHRDGTVASIRFLNIFCNCSPITFALAVSLLDRLLGQVKVNPCYMAPIGTCCFYIAARTHETCLPDATELLKLSRCGGTLADLHNTERLICEALNGCTTDVTALTLLQFFYELFALQDGSDSVLNAHVLASLVAKLEVLTCQFEFTRFRGDVLALALLSYDLQDRHVLTHPDQFSLVVELQYYCQMSDVEFIQCRGLVIEYLTLYHRQPTKLPRLQLAWSISRRALHKMKPSTRVSGDLEPIMEDEDGTTETDDDDDSGPFDSENDEVELRTRKCTPPSRVVKMSSSSSRSPIKSPRFKYDWVSINLFNDTNVDSMASRNEDEQKDYDGDDYDTTMTPAEDELEDDNRNNDATYDEGGVIDAWQECCSSVGGTIDVKREMENKMAAEDKMAVEELVEMLGVAMPTPFIEGKLFQSSTSLEEIPATIGDLIFNDNSSAAGGSSLDGGKTDETQGEQVVEILKKKQDAPELMHESRGHSSVVKLSIDQLENWEEMEISDKPVPGEDTPPSQEMKNYPIGSTNISLEKPRDAVKMKTVQKTDLMKVVGGGGNRLKDFGQLKAAGQKQDQKIGANRTMERSKKNGQMKIGRKGEQPKGKRNEPASGQSNESGQLQGRNEPSSGGQSNELGQLSKKNQSNASSASSDVRKNEKKCVAELVATSDAPTMF